MENKISVAMTTFNGAKFLREQIDSILINLRNEDELIISDDGSCDDTLKILNEYARKDKRINILNGPKQGVVKNFENAILNCHNYIVFLSDQDDIWHKDKVEIVLADFEKTSSDLVLHNANIYKDGEITGTLKEEIGFRKNVLGNFFKNSFTGCCMAIKLDFLKDYLPFPDEELINMHDWYLGLAALKHGKVSYIEHPLIDYRIHQFNAVGLQKYSFNYKIKKRFNMFKILRNL